MGYLLQILYLHLIHTFNHLTICTFNLTAQSDSEHGIYHYAVAVILRDIFRDLTTTFFKTSYLFPCLRCTMLWIADQISIHEHPIFFKILAMANPSPLLFPDPHTTQTEERSRFSLCIVCTQAFAARSIIPVMRCPVPESCTDRQPSFAQH